MPPAGEKRKVLAFIDGFNLYYGLLKDTPHRKWLDLSKMVRMMFPHYEVVEVKYFSAEVPGDGKRKERQATYWKALESKGVKIVRGKLEERFKDCNVKLCTHAGFRRYPVPVEKRTDVNLALHMVTDARNGKPDAICIISADTDMVPAMEMVAKYYPCQRFVFLPCSKETLKFRRVDEFELIRWTADRLRHELVEDSRMEDVVQLGDSTQLKCPPEWMKAAYGQESKFASTGLA